MTSVKDVSWVVGFLEGEGSFVVHDSHHFTIQAWQAQRWPLDKLSRITGASVYLMKTREMYQAVIFGNRAIEWMMTVYGEMSPRRQAQILCVLKEWIQVRPGGMGWRGGRWVR